MWVRMENANVKVEGVYSESGSVCVNMKHEL